jgi:hypothetical protein
VVWVSGPPTLTFPTLDRPKRDIPSLAMANFVIGNKLWRMKRQTNVRSPLRFSIEAACVEFCINRKTLVRRLAETNTVPSAEDECYSTQQILIAISGGDLRSERLKLIRSQREHMDLVNAEHRRELSPKNEVYEMMSGTFHAMRGHILGSGIPEEMKRSLLQSLADIDVESLAPK